MKGLVWGSDWFVWFRGFIAGPGGVCGNGGVFRRQWFQREDPRRDDEDECNDNQRPKTKDYQGAKAFKNIADTVLSPSGASVEAGRS